MLTCKGLTTDLVQGGGCPLPAVLGLEFLQPRLDLLIRPGVELALPPRRPSSSPAPERGMAQSPFSTTHLRRRARRRSRSRDGRLVGRARPPRAGARVDRAFGRPIPLSTDEHPLRPARQRPPSAQAPTKPGALQSSDRRQSSPCLPIPQRSRCRFAPTVGKSVRIRG